VIGQHPADLEMRASTRGAGRVVGDLCLTGQRDQKQSITDKRVNQESGSEGAGSKEKKKWGSRAVSKGGWPIGEVGDLREERTASEAREMRLVLLLLLPLPPAACYHDKIDQSQLQPVPVGRWLI
jgi:hypothetical protein